MKTAIGIDLGGTHVRVGVADTAGTLLASRRDRTHRDGRGDQLLDWLAKSIEELMADRHVTGNRPDCIGWALPGVLEADRSRVVRAMNLRFLEGRAIRDELSRRCGLPVMLESDAAAAAWGEFVAAAEPETRFVYLAIGTGVGATVILDGQIVRHTRNTAGQLGHLIVDASPEAAECRCGARGCLEALVSGPALERAAAKHHLPESLNELEVACCEGHAEAIRIIDSGARYLGAALVSIAHIYAPDRLVLGGGVLRAVPSLRARAKEACSEVSGDLVPTALEIRDELLGDQAGMIGAAGLARRGFGL